MRKDLWTAKEKWLLKKRYPIIRSVRDLVVVFQMHGFDRHYKSIATKAKLWGIRREVPVFHKDTCTPAEELWLRENYLQHPVKVLAEMLEKVDGNLRSFTFVEEMIRKLKLPRPEGHIEKIKQGSYFKPGSISFNKGKKQTEFMSANAIRRTKATRFKKGQKVYNEGYDGEIRVRRNHPERRGQPHYYIRISKGKWEELQRYNWQARYKKEYPNGIPKGYVLACQDGNTLNCNPDNWKLLSMVENMKRNSGVINLPDSYIAAMLSVRNKPLRKSVLQTPAIIEAKRTLIQLNRKINSLNK